MNNVTLVCGGGGVWGVAWMTGIAMGLVERGLDLRAAASFIGTSAGSVIGTQLANGLDPRHLYTRQTDPSKQPYELSPDPTGMASLMELMQRSFATPRERLRAMCDIAVRTHTISPAERRASIAARLGLENEVWPAKRLSITGVDVNSLELEVFDAQSGASVVDGGCCELCTSRRVAAHAHQWSPLYRWGCLGKRGECSAGAGIRVHSDPVATGWYERFADGNGRAPG